MVLGLSYGELFVTLGVISVILGALSFGHLACLHAAEPEEEPVAPQASLQAKHLFKRDACSAIELV